MPNLENQSTTLLFSSDAIPFLSLPAHCWLFLSNYIFTLPFSSPFTLHLVCFFVWSLCELKAQSLFWSTCSICTFFLFLLFVVFLRSGGAKRSVRSYLLHYSFSFNHFHLCFPTVWFLFSWYGSILIWIFVKTICLIEWLWGFLLLKWIIEILTSVWMIGELLEV